MIAALAASVIGLVIDPRIVTGAPVWLKPAKFAVSNAIYMFTLAWIFTLLPEWTRTRRLVGWTTAVILVLETAIIGLQAFRGTTSHFNVATLVDGILFGVVGGGVLVWTLATIVVAGPMAAPAAGPRARLGLAPWYDHHDRRGDEWRPDDAADAPATGCGTGW